MEQRVAAVQELVHVAKRGPGVRPEQQQLAVHALGCAFFHVAGECTDDEDAPRAAASGSLAGSTPVSEKHAGDMSEVHVRLGEVLLLGLEIVEGLVLKLEGSELTSGDEATLCGAAGAFRLVHALRRG